MNDIYLLKWVFRVTYSLSSKQWRIFESKRRHLIKHLYPDRKNKPGQSRQMRGRIILVSVGYRYILLCEPRRYPGCERLPIFLGSQFLWNQSVMLKYQRWNGHNHNVKAFSFILNLNPLLGFHINLASVRAILVTWFFNNFECLAPTFLWKCVDENCCMKQASLPTNFNSWHWLAYIFPWKNSTFPKIMLL